MELFSTILALSELATRVLGAAGGALAVVILISVIIIKQRHKDSKGDYNPSGNAKAVTDDGKKKKKEKPGKKKEKGKNKNSGHKNDGNINDGNINDGNNGNQSVSSEETEG